jgi:hypothetical protein
MMKNVGTLDRTLRTLAALAASLAAFLAPLPALPRAIGFGTFALYMAVTALSGTCLGYRLIGRSTCPRSAA